MPRWLKIALIILILTGLTLLYLLLPEQDDLAYLATAGDNYNAEILRDFGMSQIELAALERRVAEQFPGVTRAGAERFEILPEGRPLARMIARGFDEYEMRAEGHSTAL